MPIVSINYAPSAAPVSGQCQTTYMIEHYGQKIERRLAATNALLSTEYTINKDVTRLVQCIDPKKIDGVHRMEIEPEHLVFTENEVDISGRPIIEQTYVTRMSLLSDLRCSPCAAPETTGAAIKRYTVTYEGTDTSAQTAAKAEYEKQNAFHQFFHWSPETTQAFYDPPREDVEDVIADYNVKWGSDINTALGTTSFFSPCATETTSTGCTS